MRNLIDIKQQFNSDTENDLVPAWSNTVLVDANACLAYLDNLLEVDGGAALTLSETTPYKILLNGDIIGESA
jgi:hypothetical protein